MVPPGGNRLIYRKITQNNSVDICEGLPPIDNKLILKKIACANSSQRVTESHDCHEKYEQEISNVIYNSYDNADKITRWLIDTLEIQQSKP